MSYSTGLAMARGGEVPVVPNMQCHRLVPGEESLSLIQLAQSTLQFTI